MASKRFEIDMALNASEVAKGAKDAETALTQLEQSVGDVADESASSGREVDSFADKLVDAARKAGKSDDDIADALRKSGLSADDTRRALSKVGNEAQDTGRTGRRSFESLEDGMRDVQSVTENTGQAVADVGSKSEQAGIQINRAMGTDIRQGINAVGDLLDGRISGGMNNLLNATTSVGQKLPLVGVGIAAAAGIAAPILAGMQKDQEEYNKSVERLKGYFVDAWKAAVEGGRDYIDTATIISQINAIAMDEDYASQRQHAMEASRATGLDLQTIYRALTGDADSLERVQGRLAASETEYWDTLKAVGAGRIQVTQDQADAYREEHHAVRELLTDLDGVKDANAKASEQARISAQAISDQLLSTIDSATSATKAVDELGNTLVTLPTGEEIVIDAKTGQATADVSKFKKDTDAVVKQLDGSEINLLVKAALRDAQNDINRFIKTNNGKSFKIHGRVVTPIGGDV